ncbi:MAG: hypothetical protein ABI318_12965 [Chthoniobacteraceae bacterium]
MKTNLMRRLLLRLLAFWLAICSCNLPAQAPVFGSPPAAPAALSPSAEASVIASAPKSIVEGAAPGVVDVWAGEPADRNKRSTVTLGESLCVEVVNFDDWVATLNQINIKDALTDYRAKPSKPEKLQRLKSLVSAAKGDVALVINNYVLEKVHPLQAPFPQDAEPNTFHTFVFKLSLLRDFEDDGKRKDFLVSLKSAMQGHGSRVSVGLALPEPGTTHYRILSPAPKSDSLRDTPREVFDAANAHQDVQFELVNGWRQVFLFALIGAMGAGFLWLAKSTDVIRDPLSPLRPDGAKPYSLARAQMAFWFFLVVCSYVYLWLLTSSIDGLNKTALMLVGIPSLTALGAFAIDAGRSQGVNYTVLRARTEQAEVNGPVDLKAMLQDKTIPAQRRKIAGVLAQREQLLAARTAISTGDNEALTASGRQLDTNQREILRLQFELDSMEYDLAYLKRGPVAQLVLDWLTENQSRTVSFHRFQMLAWTLVLSIIFMARVLDQLTMPEFSDTVLGLMGISSGTYLGFRLPDQKPA